MLGLTENIYVGEAPNLMSVYQYYFTKLKGWLVIKNVNQIVVPLAKNLSKNFLKKTFPLNESIVYLGISICRSA